MSVDRRPCDLVIFGAMGDLCRRKLIPALYHLEGSGLLEDDTKIIGVVRREETKESFREKILGSLKEFSKDNIRPEIWEKLASRMSYSKLDLSDLARYHQLGDVLDPLKRVTVNYFAVPPPIYGTICEGLAGANLVNDETRVVLEKPIGYNYDSSVEINDAVASAFEEHQIYRIDHYLGKETVLNLLALRFANSIFTTNWDHETIDHVQITVAEEVGIEGRWGYFDKSGQLRDMVQNHLLQILTFIAMDPPVKLETESIRNEKLKVLKALRPITID
ncbi:MAG: glucose-6-phosphate dehydrogenase, partial [Deltaproteobacteria bacterium]